jgi:WD40 repeat protein
VVRGALVLPDGRVLSWSADGTLRVWDLTTGEARALTGHEDSVVGALVLPDGGVLSWSRERFLRRYDIDRDDEGHTFYFDGAPTVVLPVGASQFFVGDALGCIHVLEWVSPALS